MKKKVYVCDQKIKKCCKSSGCAQNGGDCRLTTNKKHAVVGEGAIDLNDLLNSIH